MSEIKFTPQQQKVLNDTNTNMLVSASAGSGKTAVIIERIAKQLKTKQVKITELLVVTFTEAAAQEIKSRLITELNKYAEHDKNIAEQLEDINNADISTLHSFCQKIIKQYFFELSIDPSFTVISESTSAILKEKVLNDILIKNSKTSDEAFSSLCETFLKERNFNKLKENILSVYDFLCSVKDKKEYLKNIALTSYNTNLDNNLACVAFNDYILRLINAHEYKFNLLLKDSQIQNHRKVFETCKNICEKLAQFKPQNTFATNFNLINNLIIDETPRLSKESNETQSKDQYKELREELSKALTKIKEYFDCDNIEEIKSRLTNCLPVITKFLELVEEFEKEFTISKQTKNLLDFNDLERYAIQVLQNNELKKSLQAKYKFIYVDEYQDINYVQESILENIVNGKNMIMVGDIKQSIYGFRNSNPQIFINKSLYYSQDDKQGQLINLNENFRSNKKILEFINSIFNVVMTKGTCGIDYKNDSSFNGKSEYEEYNQLPTVCIDLIDNSQKQEPQQIDRQVYSLINDTKSNVVLSDATREAQVVADRIKELTDGKKYYYDVKSKQKKIIDFENITILCRDRSYLKEFSEELIKYNIPVMSSISENIYQNHEILFLLSFLKYINNSNDDISLVTILSSALIGISFDDLAKIRLNFEGDFCKACLTYANEKTDGIAFKLNSFYKIIEHAKCLLHYGSVYEVLCYLDNTYNILTYYLALPDGRKRHKLLREYIDSFIDSQFNNDLYEYLNFVEQKAGDIKNKSALNLSSNSVTIDTMHSSKGLEFNIVFVVGLGREFSKKSTLSEISKNNNLGIAINYYNLQTRQKQFTIAKRGIDIKNKEQEFLEEMRLLYVALSRAKNHLFMIGHCNTQNLTPLLNDYDVKNQTSHMGLICACFTVSTINNIKAGKKQLYQGNEKNGFVLNVLSNQDFCNNEYSQKIVFDKNNINEKLFKTLSAYLNHEYKFKNTISIAQKNSVTSLIRAQSVYENLTDEPQKLTINESKNYNINAAKLGTYYHLIMQELDYKNCNKEIIEKLISDLVVGKLIEKEYLHKINIQSILNAVNKINQLGEYEIIKEKQFLMYASYNQLVLNSNIEDKVLLQGIIDLILLSDSKNIIIDFKTTKVQNSEQLVDKYLMQLRLYKLATEKALNITIDEVYIYSFCLNEFVKIS